MRLTELILTDFCGITGRWDLKELAAFCSCSNGRGKTTIVNAISMALAGLIPGMSKPDDTTALAELAGPTGEWGIEVVDSEGGRTLREWTGNQRRIRINPGPAKSINKLHITLSHN